MSDCEAKARIERTPLDMAKLLLTKFRPYYQLIQAKKDTGDLTAREMANGVRLSHGGFESLYETLCALAEEASGHAAAIREAVEKETRGLRDILGEVEWAGHEGDCPCCGGDHVGGHRRNCRIARALAGKE